MLWGTETFLATAGNGATISWVSNPYPSRYFEYPAVFIMVSCCVSKYIAFLPPK